VVTSRASKRSDALGAGARRVVAACLAAGAVACGAGAPPVTAVSLAEVPRRPDGVVIEPAPAVPEVSDRAPSSGVVALREPLGGEAALAVVDALFQAFARESPEALAALLTDDAAWIGASRAAKGTILDQWRSRLKSFDYSRLAGSEMFRVDRVERFSYADLGGPGAAPRPERMAPGDVLLRVPVTTPRAGSEALFGDVILLLLRREGRAFKIAGFGEENGP
jgi:hypothetical protein